MNNSTSYDFSQLDADKYFDDNCHDILQIWYFLEYNSTQDTDAYMNYDSDEDVYQYIIQGLKKGFEGEGSSLGTPPPMNQDFWNWAVRDKNLQSNVKASGWVTCPKQMCGALGWEDFGYNMWEGPKNAHEALWNYPSKSALQDPSVTESLEEDEGRGNFEMLK
ncbi:unnamed protein product [Alternaria alternata]